MRTFFREPLFHFLLMGATIFGLYALLDDTRPVVAENLIAVSDDDARRLAAEFEATWRRTDLGATVRLNVDSCARND